MFVKLKDKGTIFHDAGQDATVTGELPVEVKRTKKVASALKGGLLVEVKAKDAELALAKNAEERAEVKESHKETDNAELKQALSDKADIEEALKEEREKVVTLTKDLEDAKAKAGNSDELDGVKKELDVANGKVADAHVTIANLEGDLKTANSDVDAKDEQLGKLEIALEDKTKEVTTLKGQLTKANNKIAELEKK